MMSKPHDHKTTYSDDSSMSGEQSVIAPSGKSKRYYWKSPIRLIVLLAVASLVLFAIGFRSLKNDPVTPPPEAPIVEEEEIEADRIVDHDDEVYSYDDMERDMNKIAEAYPDRVILSSYGKSVDGRSLLYMTLGNPDATNVIIVDAGIHAREYINCQVVMAILDRYCRKYDEKIYKNKTLRQHMENTAICFLPMLNPDGVSISQFGEKGLNSKKLRRNLTSIQDEGYSSWKANARGVDLNRNFSDGWADASIQSEEPSSEGYYGKSAESEPETKAFVDFINSVEPSAVINLHSMGNLIYWSCNDNAIADKEQKLLDIAVDNTGYTTSNEDSYDGRGDAEHWLRNKSIPYVCIENGIGYLPVSHDQFKEIYEKNRDIPIQAAYAFSN